MKRIIAPILFSILFFNWTENSTAQEVNTGLVITEARYGAQRLNYIEITNMSNDSINLMPYRFSGFHPWSSMWSSSSSETIMLGEFIKQNSDKLSIDTILEPGESIWISQVDDWTRKQHIRYPFDYPEKICRDEQWTADIQVHRQEYKYRIPADSVTTGWQLLDYWGGRDIWYLAHDSETGTVIVDQVGGVFDGPNDRNYDRSYDVAGIEGATRTHSLVRKYSVKEGNIDFATGRGTDLANSEWIPIPPLNDGGSLLQYRKIFWTVGNHGDYQLNDTTLKSDKLTIDFNNQVIDVPWGIHNEDSVMMCIDYTPGLAWDYQLNTDIPGGANWEQAHQDSGYISARTGDTLWVYACGTELTLIGFHINVLPPTVDANWIVPKSKKNYEAGTWPGLPQPEFRVSDGNARDTIYDVPYGTRIDTIYKYFEKAPVASWEIVFVDGIERPDVKYGDLLRVTAENGDVKEYFIKVEDYVPSHNAHLASITWPDIPAWIPDSGIYNWTSDTIPGFSSTVNNYVIKVPNEVSNVPALVFKTESSNASVLVTKASSLNRAQEQRTYTFKVIAEDDSTLNTYTVRIERQPMPEHVQVWEAEPFISEYVWKDQWFNYYLEIMNPGTEPIDMSNYMLMMNYNSDWTSLLGFDNGSTEWQSGRMKKYIPGYRWVDSLSWTSGKARFVIEDSENVNPILQPGETFVIGHTNRWEFKATYEREWTPEIEGVVDVEFAYNVGKTSGELETTLTNPWNESIGGSNATSAIGNWQGANMFLMKIVGDSIHDGLKAATDTADFELVESWGMEGGGNWYVDGEYANAGNMCVTFRRKPEIYLPAKNPGESFGPTPEESQWMRFDSRWGNAQGFGFPEYIMHVTEDLGTHYMNKVTHNLSTVSSLKYIVSPGYSMVEEIRGVIEGATVEHFLNGIDKKHEGQSLVVRRNLDTLELNETLVMGDSLLVQSANRENSSKYYLEVTSEGLSNDALLVSALYTIDVDEDNGYVSGFDYGIVLETLLENITIPSGASMQVIDQNGAYVPLKTLMSDTTYKNTIVTNDIYLEVVAENNEAEILYQLMPNTNPGDAYVLSNVYDVYDVAISGITHGINVQSFLDNIIPASNATVCILDKLNNERNNGIIYYDDILKVISSDSLNEKIYHLIFDSESVTIPVIDSLEDLEVCGGNAVRIEATGIFNGDFSISWSPAIENGVSFVPEVTTEYIVTVTNELGSDSDTVLVVVNDHPLPESNLPDQSICPGESVVLEAINGISYEWNNDIQNGVAFIPETTSEYYVEIVNEYNCIGYDTVLVIVNEIPVVSAGDDQEICKDESVTLTATSTGTVSWEGDVEDGIAFVPEQTDDYVVHATSSAGCTNSDTVRVVLYAPPRLLTIEERVICSGDSVTLEAFSSGDIMWEGEVENGVPFSPANTAEYVVNATNDWGCVNSDTVIVTVLDLPYITAGEDQEICDGFSVALNANGDGTMSWEGGIENGVEFSPASTADYVVNTTDGNGCSNSDTVRVYVTEEISVDAGEDKEICVGESVTLRAVSMNSISWEDEVEDGVAFTPSSTADYVVHASVSEGCSNSDTIKVYVYDNPTVDAGEDQVVCPGETVILNATGTGTISWEGGITNEEAFKPSATSDYIVNTTNNHGCSATDTVEVMVRDLPGISAGEDQNICIGSTVTLNANGEGTLAWEGEVTDGVEFSPSATKEYIVNTVDENGCGNSDTVIVYVNDFPEISAGDDKEICAGDSVTLSAIGNGTMSWEGDIEDGVYFKPMATAVYVVNSISNAGCAGSDTVKVVVNDLPEVSAGADEEICFGSSVTLNATGQGTITWHDDVEDGVEFSPHITTNYIVTATNGEGCTNSDTMKVIVNDLPEISAGDEQAICIGSAVTLNAIGQGTIIWQDDVEDGVEFSPQTTSEYIVTATSDEGCDSSDTVTIKVYDLPEISAGDDQGICIGSSVTLNAAGEGTIAWQGEVEDGVAFSPETTADYIVTAISIQGCSNADTVTVDVYNLPEIAAGNDQEVCEGSSVTLNASGTGSVTWQGDVENGVSFNPALSASYVAQAESAAGCVNTDTVTIIVNDLPMLNAGEDQAICLGDSVIFQAVADISVEWSDGIVNGGNIAPEASKYYYVSATSEMGCVNTDTLFIGVNDNYYYKTFDTICIGESLTWQGQVLSASGTYYNELFSVNECDSIFEKELYVADAPGSFEITGEIAVDEGDTITYEVPFDERLIYSFEVNNGTILEETSNTVQVLWPESDTGVIAAVAQNSFGCIGEVVVLEVVIGINNLLHYSNSDVRMYPNPFNESIHIDLGKEYPVIEMRIADISGKTVYLDSDRNYRKKEIRSNIFQPGLYFITIETNEFTITEILIKE